MDTLSQGGVACILLNTSRAAFPSHAFHEQPEVYIPKRPAPVYGLLVALAFQGLSGIAGGFGLIADPSGESLGIPIAWLEGSPFADYRIPGIVLLTVLGVGPLVAVYGAWARRLWAWPAALLVGVALLVWIAVEIGVIGYQPRPPLQLIYGLLGGVILTLALTRSARAHLRVARS